MRVTPEQVEALRAAIAPYDTPETRQAYREGRFPRADAVKDLDMRYRWDLFHAAKARTLLDTSLGGADEGLTSDHIDTALRRIVPPLMDQ